MCRAQETACTGGDPNNNNNNSSDPEGVCIVKIANEIKLLFKGP